MPRLNRLRPASVMQEWLYLTTGFAILMLTWRHVVAEAKHAQWLEGTDFAVMAFMGVIPFILLFWWAGVWCLKVAERINGTEFSAEDDRWD